MKVGLGVGIPLLAITSLLGVLLLLERRSKQRLIQQVNNMPVNTDAKFVAGDSAGTAALVYELGGTAQPAEMPSKREAVPPNLETTSYS